MFPIQTHIFEFYLTPWNFFIIIYLGCWNSSDFLCCSLQWPGSKLCSNGLYNSISLQNSRKCSTKHSDRQPLSVYHFGLPMNSLTSRTILSATLSSRTTELRGLRLRGNPKGRHSAPMAVYMTVRPSSCFSASSLAARHSKYNKQANVQSNASVVMSHACVQKIPSCKMLKKIFLSLPKAVKVTDSHGVPVCRSTICFSLVRSTLIHFLPYLQTNRAY